MSKVKTEVQNTKSKWYKSAKLPWAIIIIATLVVTSFIGGWFYAKADNQRVTIEASSIVNKLSKAEK